MFTLPDTKTRDVLVQSGPVQSSLGSGFVSGGPGSALRSGSGRSDPVLVSKTFPVGVLTSGPGFIFVWSGSVCSGLATFARL